MKGLIILEGPDAAGKTTLSNAIREVVGQRETDYDHMTYVKGNREMWRTDYLALYRAQCRMCFHDKLVVMDRHWLSDNVYAGVYRGVGLGHDVVGFDRVAMRLGAVNVICCPSIDEAAARHARMASTGREMYEADERMAQVAERYLQIYGELPWKDGAPKLDDYAQRLIDLGGMRQRVDTIRYDIAKEGHDLNSVIQGILQILEIVQEKQPAFAFDHDQCNFVGALGSAEYLFVGDQVNRRKSGRWPFVDYGASSRVITKTLHALCFDETRAVWTNANDDWMVDRILEAKPSLKVIAFGYLASRTLQRNGIAHETVYHPSFVGRFSKHAEFLQQLKLILT